MSTTKLTGLMGRLDRSDSGGLRSAADVELLGLFVSSRSEEAFAELVRRHGGLVKRGPSTPHSNQVNV